MMTLKKRSDFLRVRNGRRWAGPAFVIEAKPRPGGGEPADARFGFTVTRQCGTAVIRNRIRRRLRAAVAALASQHARPDYDYVLIARRAALDRPFAALEAELVAGFDRVHAQSRPRRKA